MSTSGSPLELSDVSIIEGFAKTYMIPFVASWKGKKVFGKVFFFPKHKIYDDVRDKYNKEVEINRTLVSGLVKYTPHLTRCLKIVKNFNGYSFLQKHRNMYKTNKGVSILNRQLHYLDEDTPASLLIYEYSGAHPLKTYVNKLSEKDLYNVLFQIAFTVLCFERVGVHHGDMFCRTNIMLRKEPKAISLTYNIDGESYTIFTKWFVTVIDFDLATRVDACSHTDDLVTAFESVCKAINCDDKKQRVFKLSKSTTLGTLKSIGRIVNITKPILSDLSYKAPSLQA